MELTRNTFFTRDKAFYAALFPMLITVALQNLITYSVNMVDNIMLGSYGQASLSGAATVNQLFFLVQEFAVSLSNTLVALASQYWAEERPEPIRRLTGVALKLGVIVSVIVVAVCLSFPTALLRLFTNNAPIIAEGRAYLLIVAWSFLPFVLTQVLMAMLRAVKTVKISFWVSVVSLFVNIGINYVMIFGKLGFPEMGVRGAAIGTLIARFVELGIVVVYLLRFDEKIHVFRRELLEPCPELRRDYRRVYLPIMCSTVLWGFSVPVQTAILGHLTANAIAANSVSTTFYQYLKVIVSAMSAVSAVMIGSAIGKGEMERIRSDARTLAVIDVSLGVVLGTALLLLRGPLLSFYSLNPETMEMANRLIMIMSVVMIGMSFEMPVCSGIFSGSGDGKFTMKLNLISTWLIVMPLSFAAAFWWRLPVELVVVCVQSDQIFKCLPTFLHFRKYQWMKKLTR